MKILRLAVLLLLLFSKMEARGTDTLFRTIRHFTNADGLPQNSVKAIGRDTAGFIWMATESGLTRFDGARFQTFTSRQYALHSNRFTALLSWPGLRGLYAFTDRKEILTIKGGKPVKDFLFLPAAWRSDFSWRGFPDRLFNRNIHLQVGNNCMWQTGDSLLFPVSSKKIFVVTPGAYALYEGDERRFSIAFGGNMNERLFVLDDQLFNIDVKSGRFYHFTANGIQTVPVTGLPETDQAKPLQFVVNPLQPGYALVGTTHSVYMIRFKNGGLQASKIADNFNIEKEEIISVWFDEASQKLLLGSSTKGLFILARPSFISTFTQSSTDNQVYYAQAVTSANTILIGQGLLFQPPLTRPSGSWSLLPKLTDKYSLLTDQQGFLWTKRDSNVYRLTAQASSPAGKWTFTTHVTQLANGFGNTVLVSLYDGSVHLVTSTNKESKRLCQLPAEVTFMVQENANVIWLGTIDGLYYFDLRKNQYHLIPSSDGKHIRSIYLDGDKQLWVSTYGHGFFLVKNDRWISFPADAREYLLNTHCIVEDKNGFFWITTNNGLFQVAKADLLAYAQKPSFEPYYHYYSEDDGLPTNEFNGGCNPCGVVLADGAFSFPSMNGLVWFNPGSSRPVMPDRPVYIDKILLDNQEINYSGVIDLPRRMQQLKVEINTPFLGNRENIRLQYALYRKDERPIWLPVDNDMISFATLPSGHYILEIRKTEGFGPGNYTQLRMHLYMPLPWYLHPLPVALIMAIMLTAAFILYRFRTRYIRRRNTLLENKVAEQTQHLQQTLANLTQSQHELMRQLDWQQKMLAVLSHDIKAPLKYLMLATDRIRQGILNDHISAYQEPVKTVYEYSRRLYYTMENLLQYIKTQLTGDAVEKKQVDLYRVVEEKQQIFKDIARGSQTVIENRIPREMKVFTNQPLLAVILHNLIDNAVKVTEKGAITVDAATSSNGTLIYVRDTGIGMTPQMVQWINSGSAGDNPLTGANPSGSGIGLYIVKGLADLLEINISVHSTEAGTAFHLLLSGEGK